MKIFVSNLCCKTLNTCEYFYDHVIVSRITKNIIILPASFVSGCGQSFCKMISTRSWSSEMEFHYVKTRKSRVHQGCHETMHTAYQRSGVGILKIDDLSVIKEMKEKLGGHDLISFSTPEFAVHAQAAYCTISINSSGV
jgi:hypothetical protein